MADTPTAWRIHSSVTGHLEIACRGEQYLLVAEPCDGVRWEADVSEAVEAAVAARTEALTARVAQLVHQLAVQEKDLEFAREMLQLASDRGFLERLGTGG